MTSLPQIHSAPLPQRLVDGTRQLAAAAESADGAPPFSEQSLMLLARAAEHLANDGAQPLKLASIAHPQLEHELAAAAVVISGTEEPDLLELVVHPSLCGEGLGTQLVRALQDQLPAAEGAQLRAWAHGGHPGAPRLAANFGWEPVRELRRMRLENSVGLPERPLPAGIRIRSFVPGEDDQAWLNVNAQAFAEHPEQGQLTQQDLQDRIDSDWFSADGFLVAEASSANRMLGFHWTKFPPNQQTEQLGEVYAVGVDPQTQGSGLGASLTVAGIEHLRRTGADAVVLYVDADNTAAVKLYERLGFTIWDVDVQYAPGTDLGN